MRRRNLRLGIPGGTAYDRLLLPCLVILSVGLLLVGKTDIRLVDYIRAQIGDGAAPVLSLLNRPVVAARAFADNIGGLLALHAENQRLRDQNEQLLRWQAEATRLAVENAALRKTLSVPPLPATPVLTAARVVGDSGGPFLHARLIDAGADRGIERGMAAIDANGLAGLVVDAGRSSARVLLLTDVNSRVPVLVGSSGDQAILTGNNSNVLQLAFLPLNPRFKSGDMVLTSGTGGLIPPGLAVGRVTTSAGHVVVQPFVDWARLDFLEIVRYVPPAPPEQDALPGSGPLSLSSNRSLAAAGALP